MKRIFHLLIILLIVLPIVPGCNKKATIINGKAIPPIGQSTPWPEWIFHHWVWLNGDQTTANQLVDDYLSRNIPVAAINLDSDWQTDYNTFLADTSVYPDLKSLIDYFHSKNIRVLFWITGIIDTNVHPLYDTAAANHYFMQASATSGPVVQKWWHGHGSIIDLYNPKAVAWWKGMMDNMLNLGIDGWKCDGTDFYASAAPYSPALGTNIPSNNDYSHKYYQLFFDYTRQKLGIDRAIMSRPIDNYGLGFGGNAASFTPKEIGWSCWVGDQDATYTGLQNALNNMYWSDQYGYLGFGSDIGGYRTDASYPTTGRAKDVFIRWAQLGAFCGLMENGGGGEHRPWMFDQETSDIYKQFVLIREQMVPYLMKTASARYAQQKSMMHFFNSTNYSYLLGDDIFVAPILDGTGTETINFPAGSNWVYLFNKSQVYTGGTNSSLSFALNEYPVFIRQGAADVGSLTP